MPVRCDAAILSENWGISAVGQRCGKRSNDANLPMVLDLQLGRKAPLTLRVETAVMMSGRSNQLWQTRR